MVANPQEYLRASDGVGEAVRAIVVVEREIGSAEINVDSVLNWPAKFIATSGMIDTETGTFDPDTVTVFYGRINGTYIEIEEYAPGYSDNGNAANEVIVLKPTTPWADGIAASVDQLSDDVEAIEEVIDEFDKRAFLAAHPVGSTYWNETVSTDPGTTYGGTWVALPGTVLGGKSNATGSPFNVPAGTSIGAHETTLTIDQMPSHTHIQNAHAHNVKKGRSAIAALSDGIGFMGATVTDGTANPGSVVANTTATNQNTGGGQAHSNIQVTLVGYLWKRTA